MSSSKIHTPENLPPVSSSETTSPIGSILSKKRLLGLGLIVIGFALLLILKSFSHTYFSLISKNGNSAKNETVVDFKKKESQISQNKVEDQATLPQSETFPSSKLTNSIHKADNLTPLSPEVSPNTSPIIPQVSESMSSSASSPDQMLSNSLSSNASPTETKTDTQMSDVPQVDISALENKIQSLNERLNEEENQKIRRSEIWSKFQQLQQTLEQSKNFDTELQQFSVLFSPQGKIFDSLHSLEPYAKIGLPSLDELLQKFVVVKQETIQILEQQETGWRRLRFKLMSWIQIYNTKIIDPTLVNSWTLINLEKAVAMKNLDLMIKIIVPLKKENFPTFNLWCRQLQNYQRFEQIKKNLLEQTIFEIIQPSTLQPNILK